MIVIHKLSKSFGSNSVLSDINISFEAGKVYGIIGENGSGKTTLFRCISGLENFEGAISSTFDLLKNHMGFLQTEPFFFSKITGREYLQLFCNARDIKNIDFEKNNVFGLPLDRYAKTYSTGMKKKLALMAILLQKNEVIILDEPFNGVDIQSNMLIVEIIHKLKSLKKTVIISSHIFSTLHDTCDEIHRLKQGVFVEKILKQDFSTFEQKMKEYTIGNKIELLSL